MAHEIKSLGISSVGENNQQYAADSNDKTSTAAASHHLAHSSSLLSNYDANYAAGMSSDSELSRGRRHHHHTSGGSAGTASGGATHHHRPYSSQSRVYHAHPVPRVQGSASSRTSHYSDSTVAATYMSTRLPIQQQNLIQQKQSVDSAKKIAVGASASAVTTPSGHPLTNQPASAPSPLTGTPPNLPSGSRAHFTHQTSISSSGSGGSASYMSMNPNMDPNMSPTLLAQQQQQQQQLARLKSAGRQLPQRPFKQSMSIDHHSLMVGQQYSTISGQQQSTTMLPQQLPAGTGAPMGTLVGSNESEHQSIAPDLSPYQQQSSSSSAGGGSSSSMWQSGPLVSQQQHRQSAPTATSSPQSLTQQQHEQQSTSINRFVSTGQRNFRHDLETMDRQTANLSLYDSNSNLAGANLPPTIGRPSSTSSVRQLPMIDPNTHHHQHHSSAALLTGSMSVDRHHTQLPPRHHQANDASLPPTSSSYKDAYTTSSNIAETHRSLQLLSHQQMSQPSTSPEWIQTGSSTSTSSAMSMPSSHSLSRSGDNTGHGNFKQATSMDPYPMQGMPNNRQQQQQQQQHYMPHYYSTTSDPYQQHGLLSYANSSPVAGYDSPTRLQHHQQQQQQQQAATDHYLAYSDKQRQTNEVYYPHPRHILTGYSSAQAAHHTTSIGTPTAVEGQNLDHIQPDNLGHVPPHPDSYPTYVGNFKRDHILTGRGSSSDHSRPTMQHQLSSSSSNNSQSGSLNNDNRLPGEHLKPASSAPTQHHQDPHIQYHPQHLGRSPQHKSSGNLPHHRSDMLRLGYTSAATTYESSAISGGGGAGSNTALSDIGDISISQSSTATHSGAMMSHSLGSSNRKTAVRAVSPSTPYEAGTTSAGSSSQVHHPSESKEASSNRSESTTGLPNGNSGTSSSLTKKSNSATQLSMTGTKKRLGFRKKQVTSFSVHRSEEVAPFEARHLVKQGSSVSEGDSSMSGDSSSRSWSNSNFKQQTSDELASMSFIDGLGKGQMISRQGLASPYLGDIQLSLCDRRGNLEVEVIRARNLQAKTNKILPLTYVKLYLVKNRKCLAKAKTTLSNKRTLNPLFQQQLTFHEDYRGCILQSIVWGNFGKMDKKNFMGITQISIDDLELSDTVISWYKLFLPSSLQTLPSKSLRHTLLSNSTESFTNANNP